MAIFFLLILDNVQYSGQKG